MRLFKSVQRKFRADIDQREIVSGTFVSFSMKALGMLTGYLFAFSVARLLGAEAWGAFSLALSVITFGGILALSGLDTLLLKQFSSADKTNQNSGIYSRALILVLSLSSVISVIVYLGAGYLATALFSNPDLITSFRIAAFAILPFSIMSLNGGVFQGLKKIRLFVFIRFVSHHLGAVILFLALLPVWQQYQIVVFSYTVSLYLIAAYTIKEIKKEGILIIEKKNGHYQLVKLFSLFKTSLPFLFVAALFFVKGWIDTIMVGVFMTSSDVGVYTIALKLSGLLLIMVTAVNVIAAPKFSESFSANKMVKLKRSLKYPSAIIFYTTLPLFLVLILFPEEILSVFGEDFRAGKNALIILSIGCFINALCGTTGYFMQMTGNQVALQTITFGAAILGVVLNLILIPVYGLEGAALATAAGMIFWSTAGIIFVRRKYNMKTYFSFFE
ncbi:MAG: flippase [Balneolaceae bacterium]|nr:flippase [Balneolaceae bacterium]